MAFFWSGKKTSRVLALLCTGAFIQSTFPEMTVLFSFIVAILLGITKED